MFPQLPPQFFAPFKQNFLKPLLSLLSIIPLFSLAFNSLLSHLNNPPLPLDTHMHIFTYSSESSLINITSDHFHVPKAKAQSQPSLVCYSTSLLPWWYMFFTCFTRHSSLSPASFFYSHILVTVLSKSSLWFSLLGSQRPRAQALDSLSSLPNDIA